MKTNYTVRFAMDVLKSAEGGPGTSTAVSSLKGFPNVRAASQESSLVGHSLLVVEAATKTDLRKALTRINDYGYFSGYTISEALRYNTNRI